MKTITFNGRELQAFEPSDEEVIFIDDEDFDRVSKHSWYKNKSGQGPIYAAATIKQKLVRMHSFIMNPPNGMEVDHINGNTLDNRKENLRICTRQENAFNLGERKDNTSGYKGVTWSKKCKKWQAQIQYLGKRIYLGVFSDLEKASQVYEAKAKELFGEFKRQ